MSSQDDGVDSSHDVVVIGAGPAGGAPTKTFREAAVYLSSFEKEKVYRIALSAPQEVMYLAVRARARVVSERLRQATLERIRERGVHLVRGEGRLEAPRRSPAPGKL